METSSRSQNILHRIVEARIASIAHRKRVLPEVALKIAVEKKVAAPRDFASALTRPSGLHIISELKKASPSRGVIRQEYAPAALAATRRLVRQLTPPALADRLAMAQSLAMSQAMVRTAASSPGATA